MGRPEKLRLGDVLIAQKLISQEQLKHALEEQKRSGRRLGRVLVDAAILTEEQIAEGLARQLGLAYIALKYFNVQNEVVRRLPEAQARRHRALVLEDRKDRYLVGMADPTDLFAFDELTRVLRKDLEIAVVSEGSLLQTVDRVYRRTEEITGLAKELEQDLGDSYVDFGALSLGAEDAPVVKLLQSLFDDAVQVKASDVHIEPQERNVQIRFRIDGALMPQAQADMKIGPAMALRLKLMAGLDISEKRLPQDGRFNVKVRDIPVDVRMSTMPTQYGESVVMRLLNQQAGVIKLERLGMPADMLARFRESIHRPTGMILVTGPTGSGKTTTLYSALSELNTADKKIITVEDPVEYRLPGINQVQINEKIELTFARVLRSALRQDPDIILVGEMRDEETAQIGLRAALTGHLVLSTLHTKDAISTPIRLMDMGAPHYMVASSLHAVIAQRLIRLVCESCSRPYPATDQEAAWVRADFGGNPDLGGLARGAGCSHCNGIGYAGRTGIYEMLEMSAELVHAAHRNDPEAFTRHAREQLTGQTFRHRGLELALAGRTTLDEVLRVASQAED
ncbi:MAG: Flp pilus assembly complex ATPase component TadA [Betaproteobacteria bacterium]|nr:Flp pilus assembly complex ATPase component TadA [Betaproteobacteria bacterium]